MNNAPETTSQPFTSSSRAKSRSKLLQVLEHRPEQPFGQRSVATLIGMGKVVATRSSGSAQGRKRAAVQSQRVTDVVQADGVSQLRKEHADHVTPCTEGTCHGIHTRLARKFRNQMRRNEIAKLSKNAEFGCGWFGVSFFHLCRVTELKNHSNHFFLCFNQDSYGMAVRKNRISLLIINRSLHGEFSPQSSEVNYLPEGTPVVSASLTNNVVSQMCWLWRFGALATQSCGWQKSSEGCHVLLGEKTTDHKDVDSRLPLTENVVSSVDPRISILRGSLK